jgi:DNA processing protein
VADARLRLLRTPGIGPVTWRQLVARFGSAERAIEALPQLARRGGGAAPAVPSATTVEREEARTAAAGAAYLFWGDPAYPALLAELESAPVALIWRGRLDLLTARCVAMVGARNASALACRFARGLAHDLAEAGATVVSGLARGIDTAAHVGAGNATVGVIASGIDIAFSPENAALQDRLGTEALVLAEQPPGTEPLARFFPSRNRIIAGLSAGTVVVEAAPKSGSLITARLAAEAGREVMAVPGHPSDPRAQGCNALIRDGATLIGSAAEVLEALAPLHPASVRAPGASWGEPPAEDASEAERRDIARLIGPTPVPVDEVIRLADMPPATVQLVLLELELAGRLTRHAGGRVSLD